MTEPRRRGDLARRLVAPAGALAALATAVVGWWSAVVALRWARAATHVARFGLRLVTLRAYRRCPDCLRVLRREALVCRSCGARRG